MKHEKMKQSYCRLLNLLDCKIDSSARIEDEHTLLQNFRCFVQNYLTGLGIMLSGFHRNPKKWITFSQEVTNKL